MQYDQLYRVWDLAVLVPKWLSLAGHKKKRVSRKELIAEMQAATELMKMR